MVGEARSPTVVLCDVGGPMDLLAVSSAGGSFNVHPSLQQH